MRGGQWQVLYLMRGLREHGHEVALLDTGGALSQRAAAEQLPLVRSLGAWKPDLVHVHDAHAHTHAALFCRRPFIVSRRVGFPIGAGWLSRWKYRRAAHSIAVSQFVANTLEQAGLKPETISVVYDGVPAPPLREIRVEGPIVALLNEDTRKGTGMLQEAAAQAGVEVRLSTNLPADLASARAFAYITGMQGLGSAALIAMAAGVPVIASNSGGLPEIVEHERTGLLVENRTESIAVALRRILQERDLAGRLARAAYARTAERFSVEAMVRGTETVYERVLA